MRSAIIPALIISFGLLMPQTASAGPALLFDAKSGKVLYAEDADHQWHPASLTKIMTAYLVFEALRDGKLTLKTKIPSTLEARKQPPSKVGLPKGASLLVNTALKALIVKSANDVAVMLAQAVAGSTQAFANKMNATAKRLGMTRTHFVNPNGLPAKAQVTTARDLAKLSRAVMKEFPQYAHYWTLQRFRIGKIRLRSHNALLRTFEGADGLKTGFICDSGFNIVASATRGGQKLMVVVLGEPSGTDRNIRAASLLEHGFSQYFWKTLFNSTSIDNMPMAADAAKAKSVRHTVTAWSCGNRKQARKLRRMFIKARNKRLGIEEPEPKRRKVVKKKKARTAGQAKTNKPALKGSSVQ